MVFKKNVFLKVSAFATLYILFIGCISPKKQDPVSMDNPQVITIMTYNVENLFDTEDDIGKKDETYLPLAKKTKKIQARCRADNSQDYRREECLKTDWSEQKLDKKMRRLADVIAQVKSGQGPDVLILQEVENKNVLEILRKKYLAHLGYKPAVLIEGSDERGIDVGVLSKLEAVNSSLHKIKFVSNENLKSSDISETRGILDVTVRLPDGALMTVLGVHLPSQGNPTEMRKQALDFVLKIKNSLPADRLIVVGGDFNISFEEENKMKFFKNVLAENWGVSHLIGCRDCKGTYYYHRNTSWSFFDVILVSKNMLADGNAPWTVVPQSVRIENKSVYQKNRFGSPARFHDDSSEGVSDHWPMALDIVLRQKKAE